MKVNREVLEDQLQDYEEQLKGLNSFLKELGTVTAKHGTSKEQFIDDVVEAEHNIKYYEAQIAGVKEELGKSENTIPPQAGGTPGPWIPKPGISSIIFSSIGFIAGAFFGSKRTARKAGKDSD